MSDVYHIDLLALLRSYNDCLKGCTVYGKIVRKTNYPAVLNPGVKLADNGMFVVMDVFAVKPGDAAVFLRDYHGIRNTDSIFMVNGSIIAYVEAVKNVDWYQITGPLRRQTRTSASSNCVAMLNFYKSGNDWCLSPCKVTDVDLNLWDSHSEALSWIRASAAEGVVRHPQYVLNLPRFECYDSNVTPVVRNSGVVSNECQSIQPPAPKPPVQRSTYNSTPVVDFVKENRSSVKECGKLFDDLNKTLSGTESVKEKFIKSVTLEYRTKNCPDTYLRYMLDGIERNFTHKASSYAMTGKALIKKYLSTFKSAHTPYLGSRTAGDYVLDNFRDISSFILDHSKTVTASGVALELCRAAFGDRESFYAGVAGIILGISSDTMYEIVSFCASNDLSITKILNENPYLLQFISPLSYSDIERIALCYGKHETTSLSKYRNTAMLNAYISDPDDGSTTFRLSELSKAQIGVRLTKACYDKVRQGLTYLSDGVATNVDCYLRQVKASGSVGLTYSPQGFRPGQGNSYIRVLRQAEIEVAIKDYVECGLGVVFDDYITSSLLLKKELFVFDTMRSIASHTYNYKHEDIDRCIAEYEELVGFRLEERQVMAVHLLVNGAFVVAGSAGSGKTTVSKCVVYTLRQLSPYLDIKFAAPTGKAAKRMQEVVGEECRTLHSMFHLSTKQSNVFTVEDKRDTICNTAFFFDESAMITIDLMYEVLRNISVDDTRICMFGDFNQLLPIGKGLPFKNLLRFMPCVFLNVTKRAAEGSNITANSNFVNECSDRGNWQWLKNGRDFFLLKCGGSQIQKLVSLLCGHYLGKMPDSGLLARELGLDRMPVVDGLTPDDIQVVSPLTKETYSWGATALNGVLQPLFNSERSFEKTFFYQASKFSQAHKFMIGDRVIHTDKNMYGMQWYGTYKGGRFEKIYGQGICNGEVGKIVAFLPASEVEIEDETEPMPADFEYLDSLRNDCSHTGANAYFVVVEYYDFISARNFYILYRADLSPDLTNQEGLVFKGEDVKKLNLFYAGTTHKLQGSQAKLIIFVLDEVRFDKFITRQMVYTMMTRGEKLVIGVGSVGNTADSMLTRARMDVASSDILTIGELLV